MLEKHMVMQLEGHMAERLSVKGHPLERHTVEMHMIE
jgi:hypothetical protein